ncbi:MAG: ATP-binding protein [Bryobacterales bacterium]|nr:ATP-binding protein [Bryobacterales bacterium]
MALASTERRRLACTANVKSRIAPAQGRGSFSFRIVHRRAREREAIRGELFQPFASFGKKSGLGLGLALSRKTALHHDGDIWADAGFQGGARFCVRLPLARGETPVADPAGNASLDRP